MNSRAQRGFTIVELLVVVSIISILVAILLPAMNKARDQARLTASQANLRNIGTAHVTYAAEWGDRQFTLVADSISSFGDSAGEAFVQYAIANGGSASEDDRHLWHPPIYLGWGYDPEDGSYGMWRYPMEPSADNIGNFGLAQPIVFEPTNGLEYFGSFRFVNARQFSQYMTGRFYDKVFYAPKDTVVVEAVGSCFDDPGEYCKNTDVHSDVGDIPAWSSYCFSPAAMFNPDVMRHYDPDDGSSSGWQDPFSLGSGFRSPSLSQSLFPNLKSHVLEHHWLQNKQGSECNSGFEPGTYGGCEPYYFNHSWESTPVTLFYDGHIENIGIREATRADGRMRQQTGIDEWGLWSQDTPWGTDGYLNEYGFDQAENGMHILTTDGIRGRDKMDG